MNQPLPNPQPRAAERHAEQDVSRLLEAGHVEQTAVGVKLP
jgi:hypothetical protein